MSNSLLIERISRLCEAKGVSINQMLQDAGVSKSLVDNLKKGSSPSVDKIAFVADYLQVSIDYLLGRTDYGSQKSEARNLHTLDKILEIMKEQHKTQKDLCDHLGINKQAFTDWKSGKSESYTGYIGRIADYLQVSADYLLGRTENAAVETTTAKSVIQPARIIEKPQYTSQEKALIDLFRETSEKGRLKMIQAFMDILDEETRLSRTATILIPHSLLLASAGRGEYLNEENSEQWRIELNSYTRHADFCVTVSGDSMEPTFKDGDIVLVHAQDSIDTGDIGLFSVNGEGYIKEASEGVLVSHNESYENIVIGSEDGVTCFGKVLGKLEKEWVVES